MQIRQADKHMQTSLHGIAKRAENSPKHRFGNLFSLLNEENLRWCFPQLNRKAAPGVDAVCYGTFEANLDENIQRIVEDLKGNRYKAKLVRRKYIPKAGGKKRPLGIPAIGDKVLQKAAALILSAIYEEDFLPCSHGYRRGKGPQRAALELSKSLHRGRYGWIVDADIKGFFDNMDHEWLMRMLEQRIDDKRFLGLIRKWLKAGILEEDGQVKYPVTGTPQGGIISSVLANIYLHYVLDLWFEKVYRKSCTGFARHIRYADDFVVCFQYKADAERFREGLVERLSKFGLEVEPTKTKVMEFGRFAVQNAKRRGERAETFDFLGFTHYCGTKRDGKGFRMKRVTARKKFTAKLKIFKEWLKKARTLKTRELWETAKAKLRGHYNYYGVTDNLRGIARFGEEVKKLLFKWLNRRGKRGCLNWEKFKEMLKRFPLPKPRIRVSMF